MTLFPFPRRAIGRVVFAVVAASPIMFVGCGSEPEGPKRYAISGTVTYDGKPVPKGFITFSPDSSKANQGPGSGATIENGKYETEDGKGVIGGPYVVEIRGSDGVPYKEEGEDVPGGKQLFPKYEVKVDIAKEDSDELNFEIPVSKKTP